MSKQITLIVAVLLASLPMWGQKTNVRDEILANLDLSRHCRPGPAIPPSAASALCIEMPDFTVFSASRCTSDKRLCNFAAAESP